MQKFLKEVVAPELEKIRRDFVRKRAIALFPEHFKGYAREEFIKQSHCMFKGK
jgi:hypothetical protein